jgi:Putative beta-barrel porin-2, OmpL-like. bbp2
VRIDVPRLPLLGSPLLVLFLAALTPSPAVTQGLPEGVRLGAFIDTYYAWDFARPRTLDRVYTTQPARHSEFNVNLAFVEMGVDRGPVRARLAWQAGTSVQSNYGAEPRVGTISGPDLSRHIQEAVVGIHVAPPLWLDAGVFYSNIGQESWASRDNPTYTRSLIADYTPYYSAGVRAVWQASAVLTVRVDVVNGWQNVSETNTDKAAGLRVEYAPSSSVLLGYSNFVGDEQPDSLPDRLRVFNQVFARLGHADGAAAWLTFDLGTQSRPGAGHSTWYGLAAIGRVPVTGHVGLNARVERYADPDGVIVPSLGSAPFETTGASLGIDVTLPSGLLWRTEVRGFRGDGAIYPRRDGGLTRAGGLAVTSLAVTL